MTSLNSSSEVVAKAIKKLGRIKRKKREEFADTPVVVVDISSLYGNMLTKAVFFKSSVQISWSKRGVLLVPDATFVANKKDKIWLQIESTAISIGMHDTKFDHTGTALGWIHANSPQGPVHGKLAKIKYSQLPSTILEFVEKHSRKK